METKIDRKSLKLDLNSVRKMSQSEAVKLISEFYEKNEAYKYTRKELKAIVIESIEPVNLKKYVLETFYESRELLLGVKPFSLPLHETVKKSSDSNDERKSSDDIWQLEVKPNSLFQDEVAIRDLQDNSTIEPCHQCGGEGRERCKSCGGNQIKKCNDCKGEGVISPPVEMLTYETPLYDQVLGRSHINNTYHYGTKKFNEKDTSGLNKPKNNTVYNNMFYKVTCDKCKGRKSISCLDCTSGRTNCLDCKSSGKIIRFVQLKTSFTTKIDQSFDKNIGIPSRLLNESLSNNIFYEQKNRLNPINDDALSDISKKLLDKHSIHKENCRILAQRHYVNEIPVTVCKFVIDGKPKQIFVYGFEQAIFDPERNSTHRCNIL